MAKHNSKYPGKCLEWKAHLSQQESSGKTIEAWCEENSISIRTFFRWKKRLSMEPQIIVEPPITPTQLQPVITANAPKTLSDVYAEYCEKGRSDRAYATRRKQDTLWEQHIKEKFGFRLLESIRALLSERVRPERHPRRRRHHPQEGRQCGECVHRGLRLQLCSALCRHARQNVAR